MSTNTVNGRPSSTVDPITGEIFSDEMAVVVEAEAEDAVTDILREKQTLKGNFDYCQERAALLRDLIDIVSRSGLVTLIVDRVLLSMFKVIAEDILSADEPVIPF